MHCSLSAEFKGVLYIGPVLLLYIISKLKIFWSADHLTKLYTKLNAYLFCEGYDFLGLRSSVYMVNI